MSGRIAGTIGCPVRVSVWEKLMESDNGEVRKLTAQEVGTAVRTIRTMADMKQLTLAIEAG
jgi:hypothetical protein